MSSAALEPVFSIPFRYLWSTNFAGDLESQSERPTGLARFVGDHKNQILRIFTDEKQKDFVENANSHIWPLVLFGPSGTGKTSLALTIISEIADRTTSPNPFGSGDTPKTNSLPEKPIVLTAADFDRRFRTALETDSIADFRRRILRSTGLVIDDVHRLSEKPAAQSELLQIIDLMLVRNRPLIITMDRDPQQCEGLTPQLISRLCGGLGLPVNAPGVEARQVIIRDLCKIHGLKLTDKAVELLVRKLNVTVPKIVHFFSNLQSALRAEANRKSAGHSKNKNSDSQPLAFSSVIDTDFITRMFSRKDEDLIELGKLIIKHVAKEFQVKPSDLRSSSRKQSIVLARGVAVYLNRKLLGTGFLRIGSLLGNRDHSTIMHANRKIERLIAEASEQNQTDSSAVVTRNKIEKIELSSTDLFASQIAFV
jgi:chromosomal replication initiator protein